MFKEGIYFIVALLQRGDSHQHFKEVLSINFYILRENKFGMVLWRAFGRQESYLLSF